MGHITFQGTYLQQIVKYCKSHFDEQVALYKEGEVDSEVDENV